MSEIDWREIAESHGLTPDDFKHEIFTLALVLGIMTVDNVIGGADAMRFESEDDIGRIELVTRRLNPPIDD